MKKVSLLQLVLALILVLGISVVSVTAQTSPWSEPPAGTVAPANNTPAPINVSDATQSKGGNLILNADGLFASGLLVPRGDVTVGNAINDTTIGGSAKLKALGNVWADQYCDRSGGNCHASSEFAGGGVTKIIAGSDITLSPTTGIGDVTINATGGGLPSGYHAFGFGHYDPASQNFSRIGTLNLGRILKDGVQITTTQQTGGTTYIGYARVLGGQLQTRAVVSGNSSPCDTGWVNGNFATCTGYICVMTAYEGVVLKLYGNGITGCPYTGSSASIPAPPFKAWESWD